MKIATTVAFLGFARSIVWETADGQARRTRWPAGRQALASNAKGSVLYLLPLKKTRRTALPGDARAAAKLFERWSDFEADEAFAFEVLNDTVSPIGRIHQVLYESDKWTGNSDRYVHDFDTPRPLYGDQPKRPIVFAVFSGGRQLVSSRGVVG